MEVIGGLKDLIEAKYGIQTVIHTNRLTATVGVSATRILSNDPKRMEAIIVNVSASDMYIGPDNQVSSARGIFVPANGGNVTLKWEEDFVLVSADWYAVAGIAASDIYVLEISLI
jgi:hypothetical protein